MISDPDDKREILANFDPTGKLGEDVVKKLLALKSIFNISPNDMFVQWETYNINEIQQDLEVTTSNLDDFQNYLQNNLSTMVAKLTPSSRKLGKTLPGSLKRRTIVRPTNGISSSSPIIPNTPSLKVRKMDSTPAFKTPQLKMDSSPDEFATANTSLNHGPNLGSSPTPSQRKTDYISHTILETLNPNLGELPGIEMAEITTSKKFRLTSNIDASKFKFRTMAMKLLESADVLDDQIDNMTRLVQEAHPDLQPLFGNPCLSSQIDIYCCGRIVSDSPFYDGNQQMNSKSLFLETSRLGGIGQRIPLNLDNLEEYSFFPGQIAFLKGRNPTGQIFIVEQVMELPLLGAPVSTTEELNEFYEISDGRGIKIVASCGPFSPQESLSYSKFENFIKKLNEEIRPHVFLLFGPLLDLSSPVVRNGDIVSTIEDKQIKNLDDVFRKMVTPIIKKIDPKIQVIIIPSVKESIIKHCSYPQDAFDRKKFGLPKNVKIFPNPSSFSINETVFGCSNLDIFKDLKDVFKAGDKGQFPINRFERITNHIIQQRRYYPLFPGTSHTTRKTPEEANTDMKLADGLFSEEISKVAITGPALEIPYLGLAELSNSVPDILIIPSELKYFAKVINGVIVINPGYFLRPNKDIEKQEGSYVVINISSPDPTEETGNVEKFDHENDLYYHNVYRRTRVDILRS